jgi:amidase
MRMHFQSATAAADLVRSKEISARELTELLFERIDAVNPRLNAVVDQRREAVLTKAASPVDGPLHGVPMTIKDAFNVKGLRTTWGEPAFEDYVPDADATVVRRLEQAGAIVVGKTNLPYMLADFGQTANDLYGVTNNPWDTSRTPGGSSGGAAAAVAAGMSFLEYGSDMVGSIRIPASFCGVYGLKPSAGTVPLTGFQPPGPAQPPSDMTYLSSVGPIARSAGDLRAALRVTGGPEGQAAKAISWNLAPPRRTRLADFRVGYVLDHDRAPVTSEVGAVLAKVVDVVGGVEGWPAGVDPVRSYESFGFQVQLFFAYQQMGAEFATLQQVVAQEAKRMAARVAWNRYFEDFDVFLCPANFTAAFPHDDRPFESRMVGDRSYQDQAFWVSHASLPGLPAVVAPAGRTPGGLPVGLQIIGPLHEDDTAITFAELLAEVIGGYEPPPL